jgi:hypothetical protein
VDERPAEPSAVPEHRPPGPPAKDGAEAPDDASRFKTIVAVLIAVTSILGAIVAWRASESSTAARGVDEQAIQELVLQEQELASIEGLVANDQRLFARYQEHILAWRVLLTQSRATKNQDLSDALRSQAFAELSLARSLRRFFQGSVPDFGDEEGKVAYDREFVLANLKANDPELRALDPGATFQEAEAEHGRSMLLAAMFTLVVVALFFLTIAQFGRESIRMFFAVAGIVVAIGGLIGFVIVEAGLV